MTPQDIESELSYAYLHAVSAAIGAACLQSPRGHDNAGIDAMLTLRKDFGSSAARTDTTIHIQLKATTKQPSVRKEDGARSYFLKKIAEYDALRAGSSIPARLLAVLFLPEDRSEWLTASADALVLKKSAYWVSLVGAPQSTNGSGCTVYLPAAQRLSPEGLLDLFRRYACMEELKYEG